MELQHILDEEWNLLSSFLPINWRELAFSEGAIRRKRGISDPDTFLRLILLHVATGLSLRQTVARAEVLNLAKITDVAFLKRLRTAKSWIHALASSMYDESRFGKKAHVLKTKQRIRVVDATTVEEPGATGTSWRIHYSLSLPDLSCDFYEVTDVKGGETYKRFPVRLGDIILGDRGYSHREGVQYVIQKQGDVVVRLNRTNFPLLNSNGKPFDILSHLRLLKGHKPGEWHVSFIVNEHRYHMRLCAIRKTQVAAEAAKKRALREARKKKKTILPETLESHEYVFILTSLPQKNYSTSTILELYRLRWQIELLFKRFKSLLRLGHVPKTSDLSARTWIEAKLLTTLIIESLSENAFFSPWGFEFEDNQIALA